MALFSPRHGALTMVDRRSEAKIVGASLWIFEASFWNSPNRSKDFMKFTRIIFTALALAASVGAHAQNCGPGTSDPQCNTHNANREAAIRQQQQQQANEAAKRDGTAGRIGERPSTSSSSVNNGPRTTGGAVQK